MSLLGSHGHRGNGKGGGASGCGRQKDWMSREDRVLLMMLLMLRAQFARGNLPCHGFGFAIVTSDVFG